MRTRTHVYPADMIVKTVVSERRDNGGLYSYKQSVTEIPDKYDTDEKKYFLAGQTAISAFKNEYNIWSFYKSGNTNEYLTCEAERFKRVISISIDPSTGCSVYETFSIQVFINMADKEIDKYAGKNLVEYAENIGTQFQSMEDLINYVIRELTMKDRRNCFKDNAVLLHGNIVNNDVLVWSWTDPLVEEECYPPFN